MTLKSNRGLSGALVSNSEGIVVMISGSRYIKHKRNDFKKLFPKSHLNKFVKFNDLRVRLWKFKSMKIIGRIVYQKTWRSQKNRRNFKTGKINTLYFKK